LAELNPDADAGALLKRVRHAAGTAGGLAERGLLTIHQGPGWPPAADAPAVPPDDVAVVLSDASNWRLGDAMGSVIEIHATAAGAAFLGWTSPPRT
jgi:hypothetical protein